MVIGEQITLLNFSGSLRFFGPFSGSKNLGLFGEAIGFTTPGLFCPVAPSGSKIICLFGIKRLCFFLAVGAVELTGTNFLLISLWTISFISFLFSSVDFGISNSDPCKLTVDLFIKVLIVEFDSG